MGNTQSPTFTNVGAFLDISDMYQELGGSKLLQSFVDAGKVGGKNYTLPYYFGSRYVFYRKDVWAKAGITSAPDDARPVQLRMSPPSPRRTPTTSPNFSGLYLGGQDWRDGISWIFANGGNIAAEKDGKWTATLDDPKTMEGLKQLQAIYRNASKAPNDAKDSNQYIYVNDDDAIPGPRPTTRQRPSRSRPPRSWHRAGRTGRSAPRAPARTARSPAPGMTRIFGVFPLPGNDGKAAPVFAGGSNIGISAKSKNPGLAKTLLKIIFSKKYQTMLGQNGLGPANSDDTSSLGTDEFAKALIESAENSKLTPAAPGWASVEAVRACSRSSSARSAPRMISPHSPRSTTPRSRRC